jgi:hypothetical protein
LRLGDGPKAFGSNYRRITGRRQAYHPAENCPDHFVIPAQAAINVRDGHRPSPVSREVAINPATSGCRPHSSSGRLTQPVDRSETIVWQVLSGIRPWHHPNHREAVRRMLESARKRTYSAATSKPSAAASSLRRAVYSRQASISAGSSIGYARRRASRLAPFASMVSTMDGVTRRPLITGLRPFYRVRRRCERAERQHP